MAYDESSTSLRTHPDQLLQFAGSKLTPKHQMQHAPKQLESPKAGSSILNPAHQDPEIHVTLEQPVEFPEDLQYSAKRPIPTSHLARAPIPKTQSHNLKCGKILMWNDTTKPSIVLLAFSMQWSQRFRKL